MKKVGIIISIVLVLSLVAGCGCSHDWVESSRIDSTCTTDGKVVYTCSKCNETKEEVIKGEHNWVEATCTEPKHCTKCGEIEGEALGHTTVSGKCDRCGQNVTLSLGSSFDFDDLTITIGDSYTFTTVKNQFSEYNKSTVIRVPVTVKNNKDESHQLNMFYYKFYGPQGVELNNVSSYFDDEVGWAGEMRSGASYTKAFYILYDGNGTYAIEFNNWSDEFVVEFEVNK